jgi:hypothetical protein
MINSGWGSQVDMYSEYVEYPYLICSIWDSETNGLDDTVNYAHPSLCPRLVSKRLCAFLPMTNCTLWKGGSFIRFTNASEYAQPAIENASSRFGYKAWNKYYGLVNEIHAYASFNADTSRFLDSSGLPIIQLDSYKPSVKKLLSTFALILLLDYRFLIEKRIQKIRFLETFLPFLPRSFCVAIRIHRTDRTTESSDAKSFCTNHEDHCKDDDIDDLTSFFPIVSSKHPFGALTLQDFLDRAWMSFRQRIYSL